MLIFLRSLRPTLAAAMAALLAIGLLAASPMVAVAASASGNPGVPANRVSEVGNDASEPGHFGAHSRDAHGEHQHGLENTSADQGSDHHPDSHPADHGCEGCFCVAATGCAAPAVVTPSDPATTPAGVRYVGLPRTDALPTPPLHHEIFRPPRAYRD
ncbi:hypothetical protein BH23GEM11_BH23GEM11_00050 [soil metagenome]